LAVSHIHTRHLRGTVLQQAIGKAASGLTYIQAMQALWLYACFSQSALQLQTAARHIPCFGMVLQLQFCLMLHQCTIFVYPLPSL